MGLGFAGGCRARYERRGWPERKRDEATIAAARAVSM
jgi:hypothetical protein